MITKHPKQGTILFGRFKPRFVIIICVAILALSLTYLFSTGAFKDWQIQLSYYNSSVIGNGTSTVVIPFTILEGTEQPITVPIQVQAITSIGSVTTKCTSPSTCNATFFSPKTSKLEYANISINVGGTSTGATKIVQISITPDLPTSVSVSAPATFILSSSNSLYMMNGQNLIPFISTQITGYASNKNNKPVPDGTIIKFHVGTGALSNGSTISSLASGISYVSCSTQSGSCAVNYTPPSRIGNDYVQAFSNNVLSSLSSIVITKPPISSFTYSIKNDTLRETGSNGYFGSIKEVNITGSAQITIEPLDELNETVNNALIGMNDGYFGGTFNSSCKTAGNSMCNILYVANYNNHIGSTLGINIRVNGNLIGYIILTCGSGINCQT